MTKHEEMGRWVSRWAGRPVTGKKYHLYRDCGVLGPEQAYQEYEDGSCAPEIIHVEVSATMVDLMGLTLCSTCDRRSRRLDVHQSLVEGLKRSGVRNNWDRKAEAILGVLRANGYEIVDKS